MVSPGGLVTRMQDLFYSGEIVLCATSTQNQILNLPYEDAPSVNTSSRGTRAWRRSIIHTAATQRQRYCTSKHTRERSPSTANCIKLHMQLPRHCRIKAKPHASLNETFCFVLFLSVHLSAFSPAVSAQKARHRWRAQRRLSVKLRPVPPWVGASFSPVSHVDGTQNKESGELSKWQIHVGISERLRYARKSQDPPASLRQLFKTELHYPQTKNVPLIWTGYGSGFTFKIKMRRHTAQHILSKYMCRSSKGKYWSEGTD